MTDVEGVPEVDAASQVEAVSEGESVPAAEELDVPTGPDSPTAGIPAVETVPAGEDAPAASGTAVRGDSRKVREGLVVSISMDKTAVVAVIDRVRHRRYVKTVQRTKRLYAHDENNDTRIGDRVRLAETRPLSKLKRWRVVEVLERAK